MTVVLLLIVYYPIIKYRSNQGVTSCDFSAKKIQPSKYITEHQPRITFARKPFCWISRIRYTNLNNNSFQKQIQIHNILAIGVCTKRLNWVTVSSNVTVTSYTVRCRLSIYQSLIGTISMGLFGITVRVVTSTLGQILFLSTRYGVTYMYM